MEDIFKILSTTLERVHKEVVYMLESNEIDTEELKSLLQDIKVAKKVAHNYMGIEPHE